MQFSHSTASIMDSSSDTPEEQTHDSSSETPQESSPKSAPSETPPVYQSKMSSAFQEFSEKIASLGSSEEKISEGLRYMRVSLSQEGTPHFREFWEARRMVLPIFKENLNSIARSKLWSEYVELTVEARRLKEILEEQSSFAMEQIDLAITSLEGELAGFDTLLEQVGEISFPQESQTIRDKATTYNKVQRELNLLNTLASRLNALRKEVMKTDMRIRFKTKFFKRLSELGDQIFPKRKKLIEEVSSEFEKDVEQFVQQYFQGEAVAGAPYYALREEIKALQGMAKVFTLSSGAFSRTRVKLSKCWDQIKDLEKERKKVFLEKQHASSEQREAIQAKIAELKEKAVGMSLQDLDLQIEEISREMRGIHLQRDDVRTLRDELNGLRTPHIEEKEKRARDLEEAEKAKLQERRERVTKVGEKISHLLQEGTQIDVEILTTSFDEILKEVDSLDLSKMDKQNFQRQIRPLKLLVAERKDEALLNLSDDDKKILENLRTVLEQKKERRQEIKDQIESVRKSLGGSGLDFEKSMHLNELLEQERELLEKANAAIKEIEERIDQVES